MVEWARLRLAQARTTSPIPVVSHATPMLAVSSHVQNGNPFIPLHAEHDLAIAKIMWAVANSSDPMPTELDNSSWLACTVRPADERGEHFGPTRQARIASTDAPKSRGRAVTVCHDTGAVTRTFHHLIL